MEKKYGQAERIWVMDRGMVSEENLTFLRGRGGLYLVGTPRAMLRKLEAHLVDKDWEGVQAGVEVKLVPGPDGRETFVLARSADRRQKEAAIHRRFLERFEAALMKMQAEAASGRLKGRTGGWGDSSRSAGVPPGPSRSRSARWKSGKARRGWKSPGNTTPPGPSGRRCRKAVTSCGPTSRRPIRRRCGSGTSS